MKSPTVEQVLKRRKELQGTLLAELQSFEAETGVQIDNFDVVRTQTMGKDGITDHIVGVNLELSLGKKHYG